MSICYQQQGPGSKLVIQYKSSTWVTGTQLLGPGWNQEPELGTEPRYYSIPLACLLPPHPFI